MGTPPPEAPPPEVEEECAWVLTRYPNPPSNSSSRGNSEGVDATSTPPLPPFSVVFHDPLTGLKYHPSQFPPFNPLGGPTSASPSPSASSFPFHRLACVFSSDRFYACTSGDDTLAYIAAKVG